MKHRTGWASLALLFLGSPLLADYIESHYPSVSGSIHDEPIDGVGDSVDTVVTPGMVSLSPTAEDRAVQEFDISLADTFDVSGAWLGGRVMAADTTDVGMRTFEFSIYDANGVVEASDFQIAGTVVGTGQYHPPTDTHFDFFFDVSAAVIALMDAGATHVGVRLRCTSGANPGDEFSSAHSYLDIEHCLGFGSGIPFCFGDQGNCPGGAVGDFGSGCPHMAGPNGAGGAVLFATGNPSVNFDTFNLHVSAGPSSLGIVIQGANALSYPNGISSVPGSAGLFCVNPQLRGNIEMTNLGAASDEALIDDFQNQPFGASAQPAGTSTFYQFWFRDVGNPNANPSTGAAFNFTNAVETVWFP